MSTMTGQLWAFGEVEDAATVRGWPVDLANVTAKDPRIRMWVTAPGVLLYLRAHSVDKPNMSRHLVADRRCFKLKSHTQLMEYMAGPVDAHWALGLRELQGDMVPRSIRSRVDSPWTKVRAPEPAAIVRPCRCPKNKFRSAEEARDAVREMLIKRAVRGGALPGQDPRHDIPGGVEGSVYPCRRDPAVFHMTRQATSPGAVTAEHLTHTGVRSSV